MIVTGVKKQEVEIDIDPQQFVIDIHSTWLTTIGVPFDCYMKDNAWLRRKYGEVEFVRFATDEEVVKHNALLMVQEIANQVD